jgi:hypothetical protein
MMRILILTALVFISLCCQSTAKNPDPTPHLASEINAAGADVLSADVKLTKLPPAVTDARADLKSATGHIGNARSETVKVSQKFSQVEAERVAKATENEQLKASFWSYRQKHLFYWFLGLTVLLGILAAVGNFAPGWWSWLPLGAIKVARLVIFAGIPHLVNAFEWVVDRLRPKKPASSPAVTMAAAAA